MFDYNKLLDVEEINLNYLDKDTLIDFEVLELGKDKDNLNNWICIEVWLDEGNKVKILEHNEYDTIEIDDKLTGEQRDHIYKLVEMALIEIQICELKEQLTDVINESESENLSLERQKYLDGLYFELDYKIQKLSELNKKQILLKER